MLKSIKGSVETVQLDTIVANTVKEFDKKISKQTFEAGMSKEEVAALEADLVDKAFESYDRRASKEVGRKVPDDWNSDNKDLMAVRKRMLRRELDKRKGILIQLFEGTNSGKLAELEEFLRSLETTNGNFYRSLEFPISQSALKVALANHETAVLVQIKEKFEGGVNALDVQSIALKGEAAGSIFLQRVQHMAAEALQENLNTTTLARNAHVKKALKQVQEHLSQQLELIATSVALETDSALAFLDEEDRKKTKEVLMEVSKQYLRLDVTAEELALDSLSISAAHADTQVEAPETTEFV